MESNSPIAEMRIALTSRDYDRLLQFYCAGLGLEPSEIWNNEQGKGMILNLGTATMELFDEEQAETVDLIEVGRRISGVVRIALKVPDLEAATERLLAHGATLIHAPVITPWGDTNVRFQDPEGLQITLFQTSKGKNRA
jgi:catechol 2,3-dioxygenase-like lactoylglutathione lyase family enzyme